MIEPAEVQTMTVPENHRPPTGVNSDVTGAEKQQRSDPISYEQLLESSLKVPLHTGSEFGG
jgi:hypothetical protein